MMLILRQELRLLKKFLNTLRPITIQKGFHLILVLVQEQYSLLFMKNTK